MTIKVRNLSELPDPRTLMPKPSDAITAMLDGLRSTEDVPGYCVDMATFGEMKGNICHGCAATYAALHALFTKDIDAFDVLVVGETGVTGDWRNFEIAINALRNGDSEDFLDYYDVDVVGDDSLEPNVDLPQMDTDNWRYELYIYEAYRDQLKAAGY